VGCQQQPPLCSGTLRPCTAHILSVIWAALKRPHGVAQIDIITCRSAVMLGIHPPRHRSADAQRAPEKNAFIEPESDIDFTFHVVLSKKTPYEIKMP